MCKLFQSLPKKYSAWLCRTAQKFSYLWTVQLLYRRSWASQGGEGKARPAPVCWKFQQKGCFLRFEWEKTNFTASGPPLETFLENPPWKNPSDAHVAGYLQEFDSLNLTCVKRFYYSRTTLGLTAVTTNCCLRPTKRLLNYAHSTLFCKYRNLA